MIASVSGRTGNEHEGMPGGSSLRLKVFISSTFVDLQEYRQAVFDAIMALECAAEDMIYWSADERESSDIAVDHVRQSDVLILLIAHRYGSVRQGSVHSVTEQEYNAARSAQVPVLAFLVDESLPWPPQHIEWEKRDKLTGFKNKVKSEVTVKTFTSTDHLSALVSQALATFRTRRRSTPLRAGISRRKTLRVDPAVNLETLPDLTIQLGCAEDGVPLLLRIRRSRDLKPVFDSLAAMTSRPGFKPPQAIFSSFRQAVEQHALRAWASDGVQVVRMLDGSVQRLFIPPGTLSQLFRSTFETVLHAAVPITKEWRISTAVPSIDDEGHVIRKPLQSEGGSNRFLGVSTTDGRVLSVGRQRDEFGRHVEGWVEWRPFFFESLSHHFPEATFVVSGGEVELRRVPTKQYQEALMEAALTVPGDESVPLSVFVEVPKNSIASLVLRLTSAVAELHKKGAVHGDLKPSNVLLSSEGIILIDDFQLRVGEVAPGWTPDWSAPEQVLGEPVSITSDIYPFGCLITNCSRDDSLAR